jgi:hypothetical protein
VATAAPAEVLAAAAAAGVPAFALGTIGGGSLTVGGTGAISIEELRRINEAWLPAFMDGG